MHSNPNHHQFFFKRKQKTRWEEERHRESELRRWIARSTLRAEIKDGVSFGASSIINGELVRRLTGVHRWRTDHPLRDCRLPGERYVHGACWLTGSPGMCTNDGWVIVDKNAMALNGYKVAQKRKFRVLILQSLFDILNCVSQPFRKSAIWIVSI